VARLVEHDHDEVTSLASRTSPPGHDPGGTRADSAWFESMSTQERSWHPVAASVLATLAAFLLSAIVVTAVIFALWLTAPEVDSAWDTWPEVAAITATAWLATQGLPVTIAGVSVSLLPWGLAIIPVGLLFLAGRWTTRMSRIDSVSRLIAAWIPAVIVYIVLAGAVALWTDDPATSLTRVAITTGLIAGLAVAAGVTSGSGATATLRASVPISVRRVGAAAGVCVGVVIAAGALAVGVSVIANADQTHRLLMSLAPDATGFAALMLLTIGYLPVMIGWAVSYLLGVGFTVSEGVVISPFAPSLDVALPVFPLLGALPESTPMAAAALPVIGLIAGIMGGSVLKRRGAGGWSLLGEWAAMIALATVILAGVLMASSGSLGSGLLTGMGPLLGPSLGVAALLWGVGSLIIVIPALVTGSWEPRSAPHVDHELEEHGHGQHHA
jgi:hypothetical protein